MMDQEPLTPQVSQVSGNESFNPLQAKMIHLKKLKLTVLGYLRSGLSMQPNKLLIKAYLWETGILSQL